MRANRTVKRPISLRQPHGVLALGMTMLMAAPAAAQDAGGEVELGTLEIADTTADSNPYAQPGAPYKARVSGDPRRVKPLAETPATIAVITETQLEESGATDLRDVLDNQPGVTVGTGENGNAFGDRYIIRGEEVRSDIFVDGLRDPGMTTRESFAVEQIEITKGPSATFGGRGTTGGAVNSITKQASTDYDFTKVDLGVGTDQFWRGTIDANLRVSDTAALRVNALYASQDVPDRKPADRERWGVALSGSLQVSDAVRVLLDYYHLTAEDSPDLGSYVPRPTGTAGNVTVHGPWDAVPVYTQKQDFLKSEVDTFTVRVFIEPMAGLRIINATRYGTTDNGYVLTGLRGGGYDPASGLFDPLTLSTHQGWQEVDYFVNQLNVLGEFSTGGLQHSLIAGAEYSDLKVVNGVYDVTNTGATNCVTDGRGGPSPNYCITDAARAVTVADIGNLLGRQIARGARDSDWRVETLSFYLMDTIDLTPWLTVHGGVRFDAFQYDNTVTSRGVTSDYRYSDTLWNGHAGIVVKPSDEGMVYVSWGTAKNINGGESDLGSNCGYGGVCTVDGVADIGDGKPETSTNLELGTKWDLFGERLLLTAALFQLTKDDVFESGNEDSYSNFGSLNTGKHRIRGIELGLVGNITPKLSGQIGATLMKSKILRTIAEPPEGAPAGASYVGKRLSNFANRHVTAQLRYQASEALSFGGTATYKSAMFTGQPDTAAGYDFDLDVYSFRIPSYWTFDAFAAYRINQTFSARLNVTNVADKDYYLAGYRSGHFLYKGDARRFTLTLSGRF